MKKIIYILRSASKIRIIFP